MLPAITFIFSRRACDEARDACLDAGLRLTTADERARIRAIVDERTANLVDADLDVLGFDRLLAGLEAGVAAHHAGHGPAVQGGGRGVLHRGAGQGGVRHRDPRAGHQHAGPVGGHRAADQVHRRAPRGAHPGGVHAAHGPGRSARDRRDRPRHRAVVAVRALRPGGGPGLEPGVRPAVGVPAHLQHGRQPGRAATSPSQAHDLLGRSFAQFQADRAVVRLEARIERQRAAPRPPAGRGLLRAGRRRRVPAACGPPHGPRRSASRGRVPRPRGGRARPPGARRRGACCTARGRRAQRGLPQGRPEAAGHRRAGQGPGASAADDFDEPPRASGSVELPDALQPQQPRLPAPGRRRPPPGPPRTRPGGRRPKVGGGDRSAALLAAETTRWRPAPTATPTSGRRPRPSGSSRELGDLRRPGARDARSRSPAGSTGCSACSRRGATSMAGPSPSRRGAGPDLPRGRPARGRGHDQRAARRPRRAVAGRAGLVLTYEHRGRERPPPPWFPSSHACGSGPTARADWPLDLQRRRGGGGAAPHPGPGPRLPAPRLRLGGRRAPSPPSSTTRTSRAATSSATSSSSIDLLRRVGEVAPAPATAARARQAADGPPARGGDGHLRRSRSTTRPRAAAAGSTSRTSTRPHRCPEPAAVVTIGKGEPGASPARCPPTAWWSAPTRRRARSSTAARRAGRADPAPRAARRRPVPDPRRHGRRGTAALRCGDEAPGRPRGGAARRSAALVRGPPGGPPQLVAGPGVVAMNAQWLGSWDVAPRSHPNDGLLDVFDGDLPLGERLKARSRLPTGTHVPHPGIAERRVAAVQIELDRPTPVWLDGERVGSARALSPSGSSPTPCSASSEPSAPDGASRCLPAPVRSAPCRPGSSTSRPAAYRWGEIADPAVGPDDVRGPPGGQRPQPHGPVGDQGPAPPSPPARAGLRRGRRGGRRGRAGRRAWRRATRSWSTRRWRRSRPWSPSATTRPWARLPDRRRAALGRPRRAGRGAGPQRGARSRRTAPGRSARPTRWPPSRPAGCCAGPGCGRGSGAWSSGSAAGCPRPRWTWPSDGRRGPRDLARRRQARRGARPGRGGGLRLRRGLAGQGPRWWWRASARPPGTGRSAGPGARRPAGGVRRHVGPGGRAEPAPALLQAARDHRLDHGRLRASSPRSPGWSARACRSRVDEVLPLADYPRGARAAGGRRSARQDRPAPPSSRSSSVDLAALKERIGRRWRPVADLLLDASHQIHDHPELGFEEHFAHDLLTGILEDAGLAVTRGRLRPGHRVRGPGRGATGPPSRSSASTTPCPASATPAATTSSPRRGSAPGWRRPRWPRSAAAAWSCWAPRPRRAAAARSLMAEPGAFEGVDAALMVHPAGLDLTRMGAIAIQEVVVTYHGRGGPRRGRPARRAATRSTPPSSATLNVAALRQHIRPDRADPRHLHRGRRQAEHRARPDRTEWIVRSPTRSRRLAALKARVEAALRVGRAGRRAARWTRRGRTSPTPTCSTTR